MEQPRYVQLKQNLLDSTSILANAIIDGTRPSEDAQNNRRHLLKFIRYFSNSNLSKQGLNNVVQQMQSLIDIADKVSENETPFMLIEFALTLGASQKESGECAYGGLGKALEKQAESILGKNWTLKM